MFLAHFLIYFYYLYTTDAKPYIPPHLRGGVENDSRNNFGTGYGYQENYRNQNEGNYGRQDNYGGRQDNYGGRGGFYSYNNNNQNSLPPPRPYWGDSNNNQQSRWTNNDARSSGGRSGGYGNYGGGSKFSRSRVNALGLHGDLEPNPRVEEELFHTADAQPTGINFDKVIGILLPEYYLTIL